MITNYFGMALGAKYIEQAFDIEAKRKVSQTGIIIN